VGLASGVIGSVVEAGVATWCKPTATRCQSWGEPALLGAVSTFTDGATPYDVVVRHEGRSVTVTVVSFCACGDRAGKATVIDLSPAAFEQLAPLSEGVIDVEVERFDGPTLPPTDALERSPWIGRWAS